MCRSIRENRLVEPDFLIIIYLKKAFIVENEMFSFFYDWDLWRSCCCMLSSPRAGRVVDTNKDTYIKQQQSCTIRDKTDIQTTAGAPMPLRPPTPSVRTLRVYSQAGLNCPLAVHGYASRSDEKLRPQCKHRAAALSSFPLPAFSIVCAMSFFTGRRFKGHGRKNRRLGIKKQRFFAIWQFQPYIRR